MSAPGAGTVAANEVRSDLVHYYGQVEASLTARGFLRQDARPRDAGFTAAHLSHGFVETALRREYGAGGLVRSGQAKPLLRWEVPVRIGVSFGASVHGGNRRVDLATVADVAARLGRAARHPVRVVQGDANYHVIVVSDAERRGLGPYLRQTVAGISEASIRAILSMRREHHCMVVGVPHADRRHGYRSAVAIIRAEHGPRLRRSCFEEELAQGMGLANDCRTARPSIFNDDQEFGVLTRHDEMLLAMLYSPALRSGMTEAEVAPMLPALAAAAMGG